MEMFTSRLQLKEFFEVSNIWGDIQNELAEWLCEIHAQLENPSLEFSSRTLDRLGGNAEALKKVLDIERILLSNYEGTKINPENYDHI